MQEDLLTALEREYRGESAALMMKHLEFGRSSRRRGTQLADEIEAATGFSFRGKKILDVGSAHAGFVIEAAARGASAWGVEISRKFWEYGKLAARGEPGEIHLIPGNFTSPQIAAVLPRDFDFVFVNDVFEHVYDTAGLIEQLHHVTAPGAGVYFSIPNGDSVKYVGSEGHYGVAALTLIPANWWQALVPAYTAFYRPWSCYTALFRAFGFHDIRAWRKPWEPPEEVERRIRAGVERAAAAIKKLEYRDDKARPHVAAAFDEYRARVDRDLSARDVDQLQWRYLTDFWRGCAYRSGPVFADLEKPTATIASAPVSSAPSRPSSELRTVELSRIPAAELVSTWRKRATVEITHLTDGAVRCDVAGTDDESSGQYGGIRIPAGALAELRVDLELLDPTAIDAIYVDGEDQRRCRVLRWRWFTRGGLGAIAGRHVYTLVPGERAGGFEPMDDVVPALVADLQLYVRVLPRQRASFIVHRVETRPA